MTTLRILKEFILKRGRIHEKTVCVSSKSHNKGFVSHLRDRAFKNGTVQYKWPIIVLTIFLSLSANCLMFQSWHLAESNHKVSLEKFSTASYLSYLLPGAKHVRAQRDGGQANRLE